jgi:hypothetical protein
MRKLAVVLVLLAACACHPSTPLSHEKAKGMIEASFAFQAPLDDDLKRLDPRFTDPNMKREILKVSAVAVKPDGPFGMAGDTATVTFVWHWTQGPLAGTQYTTIAKIHGDSHEGWKLYEDKLAHNLRVSVAGEE